MKRKHPSSARFLAVFTVMAALSSACHGVTVSYISGPVPNSSNTISTPTGTFNSTENLGITFTPGGSGPFTINQITLQASSVTPTVAFTYSFQIDVRGVTGNLPNSTLFATDVVSINLQPVPGFQTFTLNTLDLVNISNFSFASGTNYALEFYNGKVGGVSSGAIGIARNTNTGAGNVYTTTNGFTVTSTFRNNAVQPTNKYSISLDNVTPVPEPSSCAGLALLGFALTRRRRAWGSGAFR